MFHFFERLINPYPETKLNRPAKGLIGFCLHYSRPVLPWLAVMSVLTALVSLLEIALFSYFGYLVDTLASADRSTFVSRHLWQFAGMGLLILIGFPSLTLAQELVTNQTIFGNYPMIIRWRAHCYLIIQSLQFFQDEYAGRVAQKILQTATAMRDFVVRLLDFFVYMIVYFSGAAVLIGSSDRLLLVPTIIWFCLYIVLLIYFVPRMRRISKIQANARALLTGRIVDSFTNIQTLKLFAHTRSEQNYARLAMEEYMHTVYPLMRRITQLNVLLRTNNSALLASIGAIAIYGWQTSSITLGSIAVTIALVMRLRGMSETIVGEISRLFENVGIVQDGMDTIARPLTVTDRDNAPEIVIKDGEIRFDSVQFRYNQQTDVIDNLSFTIRPGEKVGLVGRSGSGKSTTVNLLLRFFDTNGGRILIDGQNIAEVSQESLRRSISVVTQDISILNRSIWENIRYGRPDATDSEVECAACRAHADKFIEGLVDPEGRRGFDAHAGERGVKLSGGQRQRIAIARILLKDAPIIILDEATSALDSEVEAAIQTNLSSLTEGKTVIAIAHRLSTIAMLDRLFVIDQGKLIENGTHEELLRLGGVYASLWLRQSGNFLDVSSKHQEPGADRY